MQLAKTISESVIENFWNIFLKTKDGYNALETAKVILSNDFDEGMSSEEGVRYICNLFSCWLETNERVKYFKDSIDVYNYVENKVIQYYG